MNLYQQILTQGFGRYGDVWALFSQEDQNVMRGMLHASAKVSSPANWDATGNLSGAYSTQRGHNSIPLDYASLADVVDAKGMSTEHSFRLTRNSDLAKQLDLDSGRGDTYVVFTPENWRVLTVITTQGELISGVDFDSDLGYLVFNEDPLVLFPDGFLNITVYEDYNSRSPLSYTFSAEQARKTEKLADYYRNYQSTQMLALAACEAVGAHVFDRTETIMSRQLLPGGKVVYQTTSQRIYVDYQHVWLHPGETVYRNTSLSGILSVTDPPAAFPVGYAWYEGGLDKLWLRDILPFDVILRDQKASMEATEFTNGVAHIPLHVEGDQTEINKFHTWLKNREIEGGVYLSQSFSANDGNNNYFYSPLRMLMHFIGGRASIVTLDARLPADKKKKLRQFIKTHRPLGQYIIFQELDTDSVEFKSIHRLCKDGRLTVFDSGYANSVMTHLGNLRESAMPAIAANTLTLQGKTIMLGGESIVIDSVLPPVYI